MTWSSVLQPSVWGAQNSAQLARMKRVRQAISIGSYFIPGLGTYEAAKAGKWLIFSANLAGDVSLAYWVYTQFQTGDDAGPRTSSGVDVPGPGAPPSMEAAVMLGAFLHQPSRSTGIIKNDEGIIEVV